MSGEPLILVPEHSRALLDVARIVLATPGLPPVVLIGGLAVTMRVSAAGAGHRATVDIDLVTIDVEPQAVEILANAHHAERRSLQIAGIQVDLIPTIPVAEGDLVGLENRNRLFVAGHRFAFEGAAMSRMAAVGSEPLDIRVATPAGLVATKSHAIGYPTMRRRATKHGSDLLDLYRLVDLYNRDGQLSSELRTVPGGLAPIIGDVAEREILGNPAAAANKMGLASPTPIDTDDVRTAIEAFVAELLES